MLFKINEYRNTRLTKYILSLNYLDMNILCLGGGPAGLYFAVLMKQQNPANVITVVERNRPFDTFGWGVVLSDQTLANLQAADAPSAQLIGDAFNHWDDVEVFFKGRECSLHWARVLRHRTQKAAQYPARPLLRARGEPGV